MRRIVSPLAWLRLLLRAVAIVLFLLGWGLAAAALHVVVVPHGPDDASWRLVIVPKSRLAVTDTFVDTRYWTDADANDHAALVRRLEEAGKVLTLPDGILDRLPS